jgi:ppGpp synthetase/RelA/SpoT-type nucleotidyltranferase
VEIQVRILMQHWWAELSEKLSDTIDPEIKYGGGPTWSVTPW